MTTHSDRYSPLQIALHWGIALLILFNYFFGEGMEEIFDASMEGKPLPGNSGQIHVYVGMAVLVLALLRLVVRIRSGVPADAPGSNSLLNMAGSLAHYALYLLMIAVPAIGAAAWFGEIDAAAGLHVLVMNVMMILILVHAAAAILHQFVLRDGLLMRMVRGR